VRECTVGTRAGATVGRGGGTDGGRIPRSTATTSPRTQRPPASRYSTASPLASAAPPLALPAAAATVCCPGSARDGPSSMRAPSSSSPPSRAASAAAAAPPAPAPAPLHADTTPVGASPMSESSEASPASRRDARVRNLSEKCGASMAPASYNLSRSSIRTDVSTLLRRFSALLRSFSFLRMRCGLLTCTGFSPARLCFGT